MSKVKVTQEQARIIQEFKIRQKEHFEKTKKDPLKYRVSDREMCLFDLDADEFIDAISNGYEVEPGFRAGDLVTAIDGYWKGDTFILGIKWNIGAGKFDILDRHEESLGSAYTKHLRLATQQESNLYNWWGKHDRGVWELKEKDVLAYVDDVEIAQVTGFEGDRVLLSCGQNHILQSFEFVKKHMEVVCFAEDRKDV